MLEVHNLKRSYCSGRLLGTDAAGVIWFRGGEGTCGDCGRHFQDGWKDYSQRLGRCVHCVTAVSIKPGEEHRLTIFPGGRVP